MNRIRCGILALSASLLFLSGCGGTSLSSNVARIRAIDVLTNAPSVVIYINNGSANGDQSFGQGTGYLYLDAGTSTFAYATSGTLGVGNDASGFNANLNAGQAYTVFLIGRGDLTDLTYGAHMFLDSDDLTGAPAGDARVRIIQAAADGGTVDVLMNGQIESASQPYVGTLFDNVTGTRQLTSQLPYVNVPAGETTVQVNVAGTSKPLFASTKLNFAAGQRYTVLVEEPTTGPNTFGVQLFNDSF